MRYGTGAAFRRALEDRLRTQSLQTRAPLVRLRKLVVFDRFLARLLQEQSQAWVVKGGFALQLRMGIRARTTKDIDVLLLAPYPSTPSVMRLPEAVGGRAARHATPPWFHPNT